MSEEKQSYGKIAAIIGLASPAAILVGELSGRGIHWTFDFWIGAAVYTVSLMYLLYTEVSKFEGVKSPA